MAQEAAGTEALRAELRAVKERLRLAENAAVEDGAVLHWVEAALDGAALCDFAESFAVVKRVQDLIARERHLAAELAKEEVRRARERR